eukprot:6205226-Pyramimonas_sp.AAC.1
MEVVLTCTPSVIRRGGLDRKPPPAVGITIQMHCRAGSRCCRPSRAQFKRRSGQARGGSDCGRPCATAVLSVDPGQFN